MKLSLQLGTLHLSLGAERSAAPPIQRSGQFASAWLRGEEWAANQSCSFVSPYQQSVWIYTVVSALAQTISAIPFRISRGERSGENLVNSGPIIDLFNRPHPYLNSYRFWEFIVTWYCLRGEAFIVALDKRHAVLPLNFAIANRQSQIANLLVLNPDQFRHIIEGSELIGWRFTGSSLAGPLASMDLAPEDVIHDFLPNPHLFWRGMSPLTVAMLAAQTDYASAQFMKGLMLNNADTGIVVRTNQSVSPEQREQILAALRQRKNSAGTADRPLILGDGAELVTPTLSSADMQFLDHRKCNRQEICAAFFRMPQSVIGFSEDANRAVAAQERLNFIENTITPLCARLAAAVDPIVKSFGPDLFGWFDLDSIPILQQARRSRVDTAARLFSLGYPVNAVNKALDLGLPHLPWGDKGYLPARLQEAGTLPPAASNTHGSNHFERMLFALKKLAPDSESDANPAYRQRIAQNHSKLSSFFFSQRRRVLARLEQLTKTAPLLASAPSSLNSGNSPALEKPAMTELFNPAEEDQRLMAKLSPLLRADLEFGFAQRTREASPPGQTLPEERLKSLLATHENSLRAINQTTWEHLNSSLLAGLARNETFPALAQRVKHVFQAATDDRARQIAISETNAAIDAGRAVDASEANSTTP